jgi:hypothetical protein
LAGRIRIVAAIPQPGFVSQLGKEEAGTFENALAVFYHRAEVDLVREQIEHEIREAPTTR